MIFCFVFNTLFSQNSVGRNYNMEPDYTNVVMLVDFVCKTIVIHA